jgi:hypothetical protein
MKEILGKDGFHMIRIGAVQSPRFHDAGDIQILEDAR